MKTKTKALVLALCAVLLVVTTVFATMAFLTSTDSVKNTFTVGNVEITLDEAKVDEYGTPDDDAARVDANTYKLIPGHTYTKDPTIHVDANSEKCWVFAKIENDLGDHATISVKEGWELVDQTSNVYAYTTKALSAGESVAVFDEFITSDTADFSDVTETTAITITAYAIQADGFATAGAAWSSAGAEAQGN